MSETKAPLKLTEDQPPQYRIIRKATCPSLSAKSTLTYAIGCDPDRNIQLQIMANSGGGFFSQEWVTLDGILDALKSGKPSAITSLHLTPLFKGKSVNTPAFLLAVLLAEKLVQPVPDRKRAHQLCDPAEFLGRMEKLMATDVDLPVESVTLSPKTSTLNSKPSASKPAEKPRTLSRKKPS